MCDYIIRIMIMIIIILYTGCAPCENKTFDIVWVHSDRKTGQYRRLLNDTWSVYIYVVFRFFVVTRCHKFPPAAELRRRVSWLTALRSDDPGLEIPEEEHLQTRLQEAGLPRAVLEALHSLADVILAGCSAPKSGGHCLHFLLVSVQ